MDVLKKYAELEEEHEYKKYKKDNPHNYLVHAMINEDETIEFGLYNEKTDKITIIKTNPLQILPDEEVFKEGKTITKLDLDKVKISYEEAMQKIQDIMRTDYSAELANKKIIILQTIEQQVWNITMVCKSLNIINIRINTETGDVIRKNKTSLMSMAGIDKQ